MQTKKIVTIDLKNHTVELSENTEDLMTQNKLVEMSVMYSFH